MPAAPRIHLRPLTDEEYPVFRAKAAEQYLGDVARATGQRPDELEKKANEEFDRLLPEGLDTPNAYLFRVLNAEDRPVGWLWFAVRGPKERLEAFIYDILLDPDHRGKGYGRATILAAEEKARELGLTRMGLHVFAHNKPAKTLYEKLGYEPVSIGMRKALAAADPRLDAYRSLKSRSENEEEFLIADGLAVIENVIAGGARVRSILCDEKQEGRVQAALEGKTDAPVIPAPGEAIEKIVGYRFHRGVMAEIEPPRPVALNELGPKVAVLCGLDKGENVGAVIRNCAAFGVESLIVDPNGASPFQRNVLRASRGYLHRMRIHRAESMPETLAWLRQNGYRIFAAAQDEDSRDFSGADFSGRTALLLGNEGRGLERRYLEAAHESIRIPMAPGVESLNVASASAVLLQRLHGEAAE